MLRNVAMLFDRMICASIFTTYPCEPCDCGDVILVRMGFAPNWGETRSSSPINVLI